MTLLHTTPRLYLRKRDGSAAEPLNAATFHQVGRQIYDIILDLEGLNIANRDKSERLPRQCVYEAVQAATHTLSDLCDFLEYVQDDATPYTCTRCHGKDPNCEWCGGSGLVEERQR